MNEAAPQPIYNGYLHPETRLNRIVEDYCGEIPLPAALRRRELADLESRNVGADLNLAEAEGHQDQKTDAVTMTMDPKTAAVVMYGVRLLMANTEAHAREVRLVAEQLPEG